jgi:hypothetical protein
MFRPLSFGLSVLAIVFVVMGCAGKGAKQPVENLLEISAVIGPTGGSIESPDYKVAVTAEPGDLSRDTTITIRVRSALESMWNRKEFQRSQNGFIIQLDSEAIADGRTIKLSLPLIGNYDPLWTMLLIENVNGMILALPSTLDPSGEMIVAEISKEITKRLTNSFRTRSNHLPSNALLAFVANREVSAERPPLVTSLYGFKNGAFTGAPPDTTNRRIAVVVHGIDSSLQDLTSLGAFLASFSADGAPGRYYDAVIGFQYTSNAPIAEIGTALADMVKPYVSVAREADIYAHSMGNLVSRYAMETTSLQNRIGAYIKHFVGLGGPHSGVPFANIPSFQTLIYIFGGDSYYPLRDLVTYGKDGLPLTNFLTKLNTKQNGPDYEFAQYFTLSGSDYADLYFGNLPVGEIVNLMYDTSVGFDTINDGLVAQYSAQSSVLAFQSKTWQVGPTFPLSHTGIHDSQTAFNQLRTWINSW